ncbi:TonB family protein [Phenylobacterium sp.]|uniref:TonB family protein n=1 Tax=Phenylobacterium sp. TaxID=1871053 RepID=UPI0025F6838A|nr:TonB family protein [Phenylobacterium sp.]
MLAFAAMQASAEPAAQGRQPVSTITFRCMVASGAKLEACAPQRGHERLDPRKVEHLKSFAERACLKGSERVGEVFETTLPFTDSPALLEPVPPDASVITNPDWIALPSARAIAEAYPTAAQRSRLAGRAVVSCWVGVDTRAHDCAVVEETPKGLGFGAAALKVAEAFRMRPMLKDCKPVDGGRIVVPIQFGRMAPR